MYRILITVFAALLSLDCFSGQSFVLAINQHCWVEELPTMKSEFVIYHGDCIKGKANGVGEVTWFNDDREVVGVTTGTFTNGVIGGSIYYSNHKDKFMYFGEIVNGQFNGNGILLTEKSTYEGSFFQGKPHGQGVQKWNSGTRYVGSFYQGRINGFGSMHYTNGGKYVGQWANGLYEGEGIMYAPNGSFVGVGVFANGAFVRLADVHRNVPENFVTPQIATPTVQFISESEANNATRSISLNGTKQINIITPNGGVIQGSIWSTQRGGSLNSGTFLQIHK